VQEQRASRGWSGRLCIVGCLLLLMLALCPAVLLAAPARPVTIRERVIRKIPFLNMRDVAAFYGMGMRVQGKSVVFVSKQSSFVFGIDSRIMTLNGVKLYLSNAVACLGGEVYLGKSDFQLLLDPILRPQVNLPRKNITTIVIDPGHGGKDIGAIAGKDYEKTINLQVALRLASKLQGKGFRVAMTRASDVAISLEQRCDFANSIKGDLYVSIHCNSANATAEGLEVYVATPKGDCSVGEKAPVKTACTANVNDKSNSYMAYYTQREILRRAGMPDRGVRHKRFYVIRNTSCPSMLVEIGYISNSRELASLKQPMRQEQIAEALAESICRMRNVCRPVNKGQ